MGVDFGAAGSTGAERRSLPLTVRVRHCSLEHAPYRVLVGHFQGLPLSGAESRLNERSDGRLERLLLMNQYPQRLGEVTVLEPVDEAPPSGMVVIGLGPSGELTAGGLRSAVARALQRVALQELDRRLASTGDRAPVDLRPLGVSTVLIGSSTGGGLPVEASVRALIDGVMTANTRLDRLSVFDGRDDVPATTLVRFDVLELTERYEDRVDLIVGVLAHMRELESGASPAGPTASSSLEYVLKPERGEGAATANPPIDAADEVWRRIDIRCDEDADGGPVRMLEFTSIGRLARAEHVLESVERAIIEPLLTEVVNDHADPNISGTLYELLIPYELKGELGSSEHLHLLVDDRTADLPWELLRPRGEDDDRREPMALRVGVLRQFRETERVRYDVRRAGGNNVLVIGNPPVPTAPTLPGATDEAATAARVFAEAGWNVTPWIWDHQGRLVGSPDGRTEVPVVEALHSLLNGDWRVVHVAAHGDFTDASETTGVLLGELRVTPRTWAKMSVVPDFVILNCCHLGRVGPTRSLAGASRAAASVGRALLQLGVRAAVVAGWAVDDGAAESFAGTLIGELLAGDDLGSAVVAARRAAARTAPHSLTWGAYQCYGDPGFSLAPRARRSNERPIHTVGELRRRVRQLTATASDQGRSARSGAMSVDVALRGQLDKLEQRAEQLRAPAVLADLAEAWGDLLDFDAAVRLYRTALDRGGSDVPLRAVQQLGNMLSRRARRRDIDGGDDQAVREDLEAAETWLTRALAFGESAERQALLGGFHKRAAAMSIGMVRSAHLTKAIQRYASAQRLAAQEYHALNWLQLVELARLNEVALAPDLIVEGRVERDGDTLTLIEPAPTVSTPISDAETAVGFWQRSATGDRLLTAILIDQRQRGRGAADDSTKPPLPSDVDALVDAYEAAFRLRSNARERHSVIDHLRDLVDLAPAGGAVAECLDTARRRLELWPCRLEPST